MKHLLNNLSEEEKNSILEQHSGGIRVYNNRFKTLLESKLGDVKPLLKEQQTINFDKDYFTGKKQGKITFDDYGFPTDVDGVQVTDYENQWQPNFTIKNFGGRGSKGGIYKWVYGETVSTGVNAPGQQKPGISIKDDNEQEVGTFIF